MWVRCFLHAQVILQLTNFTARDDGGWFQVHKEISWPLPDNNARTAFCFSDIYIPFKLTTTTDWHPLKLFGQYGLGQILPGRCLKGGVYASYWEA